MTDGARGARRADPPAERGARLGIGAFRRPSRPATTSTPSRRSAGWTRSWSPTSWSSTTRSSDGEYDLVVGDEAWDVDHFLHENPELKRTAFAWLTDFVGWLPMPAGGEREAFLTADYNAEMIEHVERFPRSATGRSSSAIRTTSCPTASGPACPRSATGPSGTSRSAATSRGSTRPARRAPRGAAARARATGRTSASSSSRSAARVSERRCCGGSSPRYPEAARRVNGLRMIVVAGPRIDPRPRSARRPASRFGRTSRTSISHLVACDLAVVQGGLTTTMELVAGAPPVPVLPARESLRAAPPCRHRLERYGAGRRMDFATLRPDVIAAAIAAEIERPVDVVPVQRTVPRAQRR